MWQLVCLTSTLKQIHIASQLIAISFLTLTLQSYPYVKKSIFYSQGLLIKRLCSCSAAFEIHLGSLKGWFQNKGYLKILADNQLKHVAETRQTSDQTYKRDNSVPLVLTSHPQSKNVNDIIKKDLVFSYAKEQVENIFTSPPFV